MSDPAEYAIARVSRGAGEAIFTRTGIGDPYRTGIPYPIFVALRRGFRQFDDFEQRFGFLARAADPASPDPDLRAGLPVGMHLTKDPLTGVAFVVTSCALCHTERVRWDGGEATVTGLANKRIKIHAYDAAFAAILDERGFSQERIARLARQAAADERATWPPEYADVIVAQTIAALRARATARAELHARAANGPPGRVATIDAFVPALRALTGQPVAYAATVGWAKVPDVIGFAQRTSLAWDGGGEGPMDLLAVEADLANGARIAWVEQHPLQGASLGAYLRQPAPRPAFPRAIDRPLAAKGKATFAKICGDCHGTYGDDGRVVEYAEPIVPAADLGVDPTRAAAASESFVRAANDPALTRGYTRFEVTGGYIPPILTNVWMRAPYGHVGQWPSLAVLALPSAQRPVTFVVDPAALYDLAAVGVAMRTTTAPPSATEYRHDGTAPGFAVTGHPFLAELGAEERRAVIEYLKTL